MRPMRTEKVWQTQMDQENRTMFDDETDMRVRITEQRDPNKQFLFYHKNSKTGPAMSQNNQQPLDSCLETDEHLEYGHNNNP